MRILLITFLISFYSISVCAMKYDRDSLLHVLNLTDQPSKKITVLNLLAKSYLEDDPNRSLSFAEQSLFISESINFDNGKGESMFYLGKLSTKKSMLDEGLDYLNSAKIIFEKLEDIKWVAKTNLALADIYFLKNEYEKSLEMLFQARNTFIELKKEIKLAESYDLIGINYYEQGNNKKAFEYLQNALLIIENKPPSDVKSSILNNIANVYLAEGNYPLAQKYYNKAISVNLFTKKENCLAINYAHLGHTYLGLKKFDSAYYYLNLALSINERTKDTYIQSIIKLNLGQYYRAIGESEQATRELLDCYELSLENSILHNLTKVSNELSDLYAENNDFEKAYLFHQKYKLINDSLQTVRNSVNITNLEMDLLFNHEKELNKIAQYKSNLKYFSLVLAMLTLLIIIIILYSRQKLRSKKSLIEAENLQAEQSLLRDKIDYKNRELTTNLMYLLKKNELINNITSKLKKGKVNFTDKNKKKVQEIISYLQSNTDQNVWQELESRFQEIHKDFYNKLNNINQKLTINDKKLCTFIRLNLSTKEIAIITHQNINSVEVSRTRLRKKLNITKKDIKLHTFLTNI